MLPADKCGEPFHEEDVNSFLPVGCGAERVFDLSGDGEIGPYGSGDDGTHDEDAGPVITFGTTAIPMRGLRSTPSDHDSMESTTPTGAGSNRSAARLPARFIPSPESRHTSFQHLIRLHLNTFSRRLSMLESNTLDLKESIRSMEIQKNHLNSQLKEIIMLHFTREKEQRATELKRGYTDVEARLSQLEGRLEILIDGFTALAQEMNRMKRGRHSSRLPQENTPLSPLTTVLVDSTPPSMIRAASPESPLTDRAMVLQSKPTPSLLINKQRHVSGNLKSESKSSTKSIPFKSQVTSGQTVKPKTTLGKPQSVPKVTVKPPLKPETKRPPGQRLSVTAKHDSQPRKTKSRKAKQEAAVTKFQLEPPAHKSKSTLTQQLHKQSVQAKKLHSASLIKNSGHEQSFGAGTPVQKKIRDNSKKRSKQHKGNRAQTEKRPKDSSDDFSETVETTNATVRKTRPTQRMENVKSTIPARNKFDSTVKRTSAHIKTKTTSVRKASKNTQLRKKAQSGVVDLLRLLNGGFKSAKQKKNQEGSLHVVLGKIAIPIRIIPDNDD